MLRILLLANTMLLGCWFVSPCCGQDDGPQKHPVRIATFQTDVTPPLGSPLSYGFVRPAERIVDPLSARGVILLTEEKPIVLCVIDWVAISNGAHDAWLEALADAVGTTTDRVSVHVAHQHDTPGVDFTAAEILAAYGHRGIMFDDASAREAIRQTAAAAGVAMKTPRRVSHIGCGQAKVEKFASNRRVIGPDGKIKTWRGSTTGNADARAEPEGTIDPYVRLVSFWDGDTPLVSLTYYASHPQSQLAAQKMRPDLFVCMAAYGDHGPGYICTNVAYSQGGYEVGSPSNTAPEVEDVLMSAMRDLLEANASAANDSGSAKAAPLSRSERRHSALPFYHDKLNLMHKNGYVSCLMKGI